MSDYRNRKTVRWVPGLEKIQKLVSKIPRFFEKAPSNVKKAAAQITNSESEDKDPSVEDLTLCLMWKLEQEERRSRRRKPAKEQKKKEATKKKRTAPRKKGIPETVFAKRAREAEEEELERESPRLKVMRKRLKTRTSRGRKGGIRIKGD